MTDRDKQEEYTEDSFFHALEHRVARLNYLSHNHYEPVKDGTPTDAAPGTAEKVELIAKRLRNGEPLFHEDDRDDYDGLVAPVKPTHHKAERSPMHHLRTYTHERKAFRRIDE